jgi:hypothetical protein
VCSSDAANQLAARQAGAQTARPASSLGYTPGPLALNSRETGAVATAVRPATARPQVLHSPPRAWGQTHCG